VMNEDEETAVETVVNEIIQGQQPIIEEVLSNSGTASIFLAYAHAYKAQCDNTEGGNRISLAASNRLATGGEYPMSAIEKKEAVYNQLILELIQNPTKTVPYQDLPLQLRTESFVQKLDEIAKAYQEYQAALPKRLQLESQLKKAEQDYSKVLKEAIKEGERKKNYTFADVERMYDENDPDSQATHAEQYKQLRQRHTELEAVLRAKDKEIQDKIQNLQSLMNEQQQEVDALKDVAANAKAVAEENKAALDTQLFYANLLRDIKPTAHLPFNPQKLGQLAQNFTNTSTQWEGANRTYEDKHQELIKAEERLVKTKALLKSLQNPSITTQKHQLLVDKEELTLQLKQINETSFTLVHSEIYDICETTRSASLSPDIKAIHTKIAGLQEKIDNCAKGRKSLTSAIEKMDRSLASNGQKLTDFGFTVNEHGQETFKCRVLQEIKGTLMSVMLNQASLTEKILFAMGAVMYSSESLNEAKVLEDRPKRFQQTFGAEPADDSQRISKNNWNHTMIQRKNLVEDESGEDILT
ncbi:MAG: hypothetical protein ACRDFB_05380, partial [Rhabdochlamydiaceae bacterium]